MSETSSVTSTKVLIVGAGPAGLGVSLALKAAGVTDQLVLDAREVGAAFRSWTKGMALLTPSFNSNSFGLTDLNAIDPVTSPADFLKTQHPEGAAYAKYLEAIVKHYKLPVHAPVKVLSLKREEEGFCVMTSTGEYRADYVVWSAGQFFDPRDSDFAGAEHALHTSKIQDWDALEGEDYTIIGGYESGVDAMLNLVNRGKSVRLISSGEPWASNHPDPSRSLSPRTIDRLRAVLRDPDKALKVELIKNTTIKSIEDGEGFWILRDQDDVPVVALERPVLATGYHSGLGPVEELFEHDENDNPIFSEAADESTLTPGLFYSGPSLVHRNALFCFIYKFRARFGVIAAEIAERLELPDVEEKLKAYEKAGFMNRDLDCCTKCECAVKADPKEAPAPEEFAEQSLTE